ncbi:hypothetical protein E0493_15725 [Roseomonas sp. M0104]|uniref:Uncharacterized protein n=1 Tax=Teichococcus coralli TaxID=2545983 RepID=A0A845BHX8_9PROT|nr:hypothetical protein [Pseudoroseomonas coralli]MXP64802.1 hypothetical protein [Pseudoroseomonas coralli]
MPHKTPTSGAVESTQDVSKKEKAEWLQRHFRCKKSIAKAGGDVFDLQYAHFIDIAPDYCPVLGIPLVYGRRISGKRQPHPDSPSIDRLDGSKGYVSHNVEIISHRANTFKGNSTLEEIISLAAWFQARSPRKDPNFLTPYQEAALGEKHLFTREGLREVEDAMLHAAEAERDIDKADCFRLAAELARHDLGLLQDGI